MWRFPDTMNLKLSEAQFVFVIEHRTSFQVPHRHLIDLIRILPNISTPFNNNWLITFLSLRLGLFLLTFIENSKFKCLLNFSTNVTQQWSKQIFFRPFFLLKMLESWTEDKVWQYHWDDSQLEWAKENV